MPRLFESVATVLLTAVIALGNCATCLSLSATTEAADKHACCKPLDVQPPCHTDENAPAPHQDDCSSRLDVLKSAQASERMLYTPVLASAPLIDLFNALAGARGSHRNPDRIAAAFDRLPQSPTPLRI